MLETGGFLGGCGGFGPGRCSSCPPHHGGDLALNESNLLLGVRGLDPHVLRVYLEDVDQLLEIVRVFPLEQHVSLKGGDKMLIKSLLRSMVPNRLLSKAIITLDKATRFDSLT